MSNPSLAHDGLLLLFRNRITLGPECVRDLLGVPLPDFHAIEVTDTQVAQVIAANRAPDLVLVLRDAAAAPMRVVIVEIQRKPDRGKERSWPLYIPALGAKWDCGVVLLVVAVDEGVARWARGPFETGHPGYALAPLVIGPSELPLMPDAARAEKTPELAVLSCIAHARKKPKEDAAQLALLTLEGCRHLDPEVFSIYADLIRVSLNEAARAVLEGMMASGRYEFQSEFVKKHVAVGREEGRDEGLAEGRIEEGAKAVLRVLKARRLHVSDEARERILACKDLPTIERWIDRVGIVGSVDELFRDD